MAHRVFDEATCLDPDDICHYYLDHTDGGYSASAANQDVFNLKKPMSRKGCADWHYKGEAIRSFARDLTDFLQPYSAFSRTFVLAAMPPSKKRSNPDYDDRIVQVVMIASERTGIPWVDPFDLRRNMQAAHHGGTRTVDEIERNLLLNRSAEAISCCSNCMLVDDVLTTGGHFAACKHVIQKSFPDVVVSGAFWAKHRF